MQKYDFLLKLCSKVCIYMYLHIYKKCVPHSVPVTSQTFSYLCVPAVLYLFIVLFLSIIESKNIGKVSISDVIYLLQNPFLMKHKRKMFFGKKIWKLKHLCLKKNLWRNRRNNKNDSNLFDIYYKTNGTKLKYCY